MKEYNAAKKRVASSAASTIGREVGNLIGKSVGGSFGKKLGGNVGASLARNILGTFLKQDCDCIGLQNLKIVKKKFRNTKQKPAILLTLQVFNL